MLKKVCIVSFLFLLASPALFASDNTQKIKGVWADKAGSVIAAFHDDTVNFVFPNNTWLLRTYNYLVVGSSVLIYNATMERPERSLIKSISANSMTLYSTLTKKQIEYKRVETADFKD
jgi:hypothetical protein